MRIDADDFSAAEGPHCGDIYDSYFIQHNELYVLNNDGLPGINGFVLQ